MSNRPWFTTHNSHNSQGAEGDNPPRPTKRRKNQFGLKELTPGINPDIDIVAIHGIDGDREDSWTADNGVCWLRDLLPAKTPNARIITYGYDAHTHGREQLATEYIHDHAMTFISKLVLFREDSSTNNRPIIFIAHSSGGILLKSALIHSHLSHNGHLEHHHAISQSTYGVAFFSTPHQGSATAELARFLLDVESSSILTSTVLLRHLERDSEVLQHQLAQYSAISAQWVTKFFYELYDTPVTGRVSKRVVPKSSAVVPGAVNSEAIGICKDHVNVVKYESAEDDDFTTVSTTLSLMVKGSQKKMLGKADGCGSTEAKEIVLTPSQQNAISNLLGVNTARFDADSRPRCLEGTRVDLLKTIFEWTEQDISREHRQIFWLCGLAGTGKTTISSTVAHTCEGKGLLGASFFFSRDHTERNDLQLVFPTLAQQIGIFHKPFQKLLAEALERDPDLVQMETTRQIRKLIIEPLKFCDSFPTPTVVVIDALDECKDENPISIMLSVLSEHIHDLSPLKFFITSRPENNILCGFRQLSPIYQSVRLHEIESSVVDGDIERYLRAKFLIGSTLYPYLVQPGWPSDEAIQSLVVSSERLFIFAATAVSFIFDRKYRNPRKQLATLLSHPSGTDPSPSSPFALLDQLYLQVLRQAFPAQTTPSDHSTLLRILGAIVLLRDPLSPGALERLLALECGSIRTALDHLHSVIVVPETDEHPIRLIHPSFFDFITTRCSDAELQIDSLMCHEMLGLMCFEQMNGLKRNICEIPDASKLNSEIEDLAERIKLYIFPAMQYACQHWSFHLCIAGGNTLQESLQEFCHWKILYWIEVLSLLGYLREGIRHLQDVSKFLHAFSTPSKDLLDAVADITRFMADHFELMSCASLQLYRSALPLSSPSKFLHKTFHFELDVGMRVVRGEWGQNSSGVTVLSGSKGRIRSVDFSPDGTLIISTSSGDEVRLWDRNTGTLLRRLSAVPGSHVSWARFFPDGSRVIGGTWECTIPTWDVATGACLQVIQLGGFDLTNFYHYAISPDFTRVATAVKNNIHIWLASNGDLLKTLTGHSKHVHFVTFAPHHMLIASASEDQTIRIWNAISGGALRTLRGYSHIVTAISFSPDSKYLVSGSSNHDIRLWDASNGVTLKTLIGHTNWVTAVAFSPDGTRVISGSYDDTFRVWDAISGELLQTTNCSSIVAKVAFSPDSTQYIWSAESNAIYISDADKASNFDESERCQRFNQVEFSTDGTYIIGHFNDGVLAVFDGFTGNRLISYDQSETIEILSPNCKYIASAGDIDLRLRDIATGTTLWATSIDSSAEITFSSDTSRIISTSPNTIQIWDVATGNPLVIFSGSDLSASFSQDNSQIIIEDVIYDITSHVRPLPFLSMGEPPEQLKYLIKDEWIFASKGAEEERCVWIPPDWRGKEYSSIHGRLAIGSRRGVVLLDLSSICLSI